MSVVAPDLPGTPAAIPGVEAPRADKPSPLRLEFLDGIRGLAALYVVLFHMFGNTPELPRETWMRLATGWTRFGWYSVAIFIVLSGYCLMLPVATAGTGGLRDGFRGYIRRRARRIMPPYYAALALGAALSIAFTRAGALPADDFRVWNASGANLLSHVLLLHNVKADWARAIDPPMWSVATEWQIYFLFPFLLLPVWRRYGSATTVAAGFAAGLLPLALTKGRWFWWASPWFAGLFALGMVGAALAFGGGRRGAPSSPAEPRRYGLLCLLLSAVIVALGVFAPAHAARQEVMGLAYAIVTDALVGVWALCLIHYCALSSSGAAEGTGGAGATVRRFLGSRVPVLLGAFSYSLYLLHNLVLLYVSPGLSGTLSRLAAPLSLPAPLLFGVNGALNLGAVLALSYLFHLAFERPFLRSAAGKRR
jgi:peptidoglycan/LPS O-acetylase OafA/YrhL